LQKVATVWAKNANIFAKIFGENIFKIITSVPGWETFHLIGDCFLFGSFLKITEVAQFRGRLLFSTAKVMHSFCAKKVGLHFGQFFHKLILSPWYWDLSQVSSYTFLRLKASSFSNSALALHRPESTEEIKSFNHLYFV
jgi:hypothetical protein